MVHSLRARVAVVVCLLLACLGIAGCSSGVDVGPSTPTAPTTPAPPSAPAPPATTITVTAAGVSPQVLTVAVGSRVTFTNADTRPHDFSGGPDPSRPECPEIDAAGFIQAGQSRQTGVFTVARTCEYHDHGAIGVAAFQGRIVIE
jgi:plastocyanin